MARILSISYDSALLATRALLLEQMGYTVFSADGFAAAWELCDEHDGRFDLIILGHSIPHKDKIAMVERCSKVCSCPVLALLRSNEAPVPGAKLSVDSSNPKGLWIPFERYCRIGETNPLEAFDFFTSTATTRDCCSQKETAIHKPRSIET